MHAHLIEIPDVQQRVVVKVAALRKETHAQTIEQMLTAFFQLREQEAGINDFK